MENTYFKTKVTLEFEWKSLYYIKTGHAKASFGLIFVLNE